MARVYVAHKYEGNRQNIEKLGVVLRKLQKEHPENSYFSPLHNFSYYTTAGNGLSIKKHPGGHETGGMP